MSPGDFVPEGVTYLTSVDRDFGLLLLKTEKERKKAFFA